MATFYVYAHMRPDLTPFYIGKGTEARARNLKPRNPHHASVVAKYSRENVLVEMHSCRTEEEAFLRERIVIKALRACGVELTNKTDGGEGVSGLVFTEKMRAKRSESQKGRRVSEEAKRLISVRKSGRRLTPEHREKLSASWKTRPPISDETKAKISAGQRLRPPPTAEVREKISRAKKGVTFTEQHRAAISASHAGKSLAPEHRANLAKAMAGRIISPEHREKIRIAVTADWKRRKAESAGNQPEDDHGK